MTSIKGTRSGDTLFGTARKEHIDGREGDDVIYSGGGADIIDGDDGNDIIHAHRDNHMLRGGSGSDRLILSFEGTGGALDFSVAANLAGMAKLGGVQVNGFEAVNLIGGSGADRLSGGAFYDDLSGGAGNDTLVGNGGNDRLFGDGNDDVMTGGAGNDRVDGGAGTDTAVFAGLRTDYEVEQLADGSLSIRDLRTGGPDGTDLVINTERFRFADGEFDLDDLLPPPPSGPVANDDDIAFTSTHGVSVISGLLANDEGDGLALHDLPRFSANGAVLDVQPDGSIVYDPGELYEELAPGEVVTDSFTYTIRDANGELATATATITVTGVEPAQLVYALTEDQSSANLYQDVLDAAAEQFGPGVTLVGIEADGIVGTVTFDSAAQLLTYAADHPWLDRLLPDNFPPQTGFRYTVVDASGQTHTGSVEFFFYGQNDDPVAMDDLFSIGDGGGSGNIWSQVLANDADVDFGHFEVEAVDTSGTIGTVFFDPSTRTLTYQAADSSAYGGDLTDSFTYTISDGYGGTSTATVEFEIVPGAGGAISLADALPTPLAVDPALFV